MKEKTEKNKLTVEWWNSLSETWKELFIFNVDFTPKMGDKEYKGWETKEQNYREIAGRRYIPQKNINTNELLDEINKLQSFIVDKDSNKKIEDLSPLSGLVNLTYLNLEGNKHDLSPISNLVNLTSLNLDDNTRDLSPIANFVNLTFLKLKIL